MHTLGLAAWLQVAPPRHSHPAPTHTHYPTPFSPLLYPLLSCGSLSFFVLRYAGFLPGLECPLGTPSAIAYQVMVLEHQIANCEGAIADYPAWQFMGELLVSLLRRKRLGIGSMPLCLEDSHIIEVLRSEFVCYIFTRASRLGRGTA